MATYGLVKRMAENGRDLIAPRTITLPTMVMAVVFSAVFAAGGVWALQGKTVAETSAAIAPLQQRLAIVESDNRDQKFAIDQLQLKTGETAGKFEASNAATTAQFTQLQIAIAELRVVVNGIARASEVQLPGDRKPKP